MNIATINPYTNKIVKTFAEDTPTMIENSLKTATEQFPRWRLTKYQERAEVLHKVATIMRERKADLAKLITTEMGKLIAESVGEIELSAAIFDYYADNGERFLADKPVKTELGEAMVRHRPNWRLAGRRALEFPILSGGAICRPQRYDRQRGSGEAHFQRTAMRYRHGEHLP